MSKHIGFNQYLEGIYNELSVVVKYCYGAFTFEDYKESIHVQGVFSDWLELFKDSKLTKQEMEGLASDFVSYASIKPEDIHQKLAILSHSSNVTLPEVGGCLTASYWIDYFGARSSS